MSVKYVYTVSDVGSMIPNVIRSIKSLTKFVNKNEVVIFFTPPISKLSYARLSKLATVKLIENISHPFVFREERGFWRYGEKCHLCDVPSSTVVFLDADTLIKKDLSPLLVGDFDFSARMHYPFKSAEKGWFNSEIWEKLFKKMKKKTVPMPNAGFMIFKNFSHQKIKEEWISYINNSDLLNASIKDNPKEQTALALCLSNMKIRWMRSSEHAFSWFGESKLDTYVIHKPMILPESLYNFEYGFFVNASRALKFFSDKLFP